MSVKTNTYKFFKNGNHQLSCGSHKHSIMKKLLILVAAFTLSSGVFAQDMKMEKDMMDKDMKMKKDGAKMKMDMDAMKNWPMASQMAVKEQTDLYGNTSTPAMDNINSREIRAASIAAKDVGGNTLTPNFFARAGNPPMADSKDCTRPRMDIYMFQAPFKIMRLLFSKWLHPEL